MPVPPTTRDAITAALRECGPMSVPELVEHLGWKRNRVDACITTARANHPGKFFRIVRYRQQIGIQGREAAIYAAGPGPDAKRPEFDRAHVVARRSNYYRRNRARIAVGRKLRSGVARASPWSGLVPMTSRMNQQPSPQPAGFFTP